MYSAVAGRRNKNRHAVEENLDIVRYLGIDSVEPEFLVSFPAREPAEKHPRVAMLPASRWRTKNWPINYFIDLAQRLQKARDVSLFLLGGPQDVGICGKIERALAGRIVNTAGKASLLETGGLLEKMDLLIANDSGPVHMAVAVGTPALVIFGPTDPLRTGPYGDRNRVVRISLPCQPCFSRTCGEPGVPCLSGVMPQMVEETALGMLEN